MHHLKYLLITILFLGSLPLWGQSDSLDFLIPFYLEDAVGNRDTVYYGASQFADPEFNPDFGEVNLYDVPYDSVLEARLVEAFDLILDDHSPQICSKRKIVRYNDYGNPNDCWFSLTGGPLAIVLKNKYPPVTVSWEQDAYAEGAALHCSQGDYIVNSLVPFSIVNGNWYGSPAFVTACLANTSSQVFYPDCSFIMANGECEPGGPFLGLDYAVYPVEGSVNEADTLQILLIWGDYTGSEPCATFINSTESPEEASAAFFLYPNPARDRLYLDVDPIATALSDVTVHSLTGQIVYRSAVYGADGVDVSRLPPGVYVLRYRTRDGRVQVARFVRA